MDNDTRFELVYALDPIRPGAHHIVNLPEPVSAVTVGGMSDESVILWSQVIEPLLAALKLHTTPEQLARLYHQIKNGPEDSAAIEVVAHNLLLLRRSIDEL